MMRYFTGATILLFAFLCFAPDVKGEKNLYKAKVDSDGVQRVEVLAGEYFFKPDYIVVKVNAPVELKVKKEASAVPHDFVLKAPEAEIDIHESLSTEPKTIRFTPKKTGKYTFYCDKKLLFFKSHREKGMEGTIEVVQ